MNPIAEQFKVQEFDAIRLKVASPETIRAWSYGEVVNPETINYRTQKPEKGGLFGEEIFGPVKDWECYCGKYKKIRYKGIICDKCGVEVTHSLVRRERMGHIELISPVSHIWFLRGVPSKIGLVLDLSVQSLEKVIYFANFIITEVREDVKQETMEQVKSEWKSKRKQIENEYKQAVMNVEKQTAVKNGGVADNLALGSAFKLKELEVERSGIEKIISELKLQIKEAIAKNHGESSDLKKLNVDLETWERKLSEAEKSNDREKKGKAEKNISELKLQIKEAIAKNHGESSDLNIELEEKKRKLEKLDVDIKKAQQVKSAEESLSASSAKQNTLRESLIAKAFDNKDKRLKELDLDFHIVEKELKDLKQNQIISESTYQDWSLKYGHIFEASIGAEAVRALLQKIDMDRDIKRLEDEIDDAPQGPRYEKLVRRAKLFHSLKANNILPEWMVLTAIPVIPPDLRPMVPLDGGRFAASDLNDLYRRVINRNNRLKKLVDLNAPEVISRNEKRMLQEAVDALIDNSARQSKTVVAATGKKRQLKSLADILKGKQGRFRQNLLGKRIDYSGRSVIVVGPRLKLNQCGIPKMMALELFKPFVISKLIQRGYVHNIRSANRLIDSNHPDVWDLLEETTKDSLVLLNRAPTLHRLGIQAFQPLLIEGKAIQIHPMVCPAFNADFDGDQMAVHVPLTDEAKDEARTLMLSTQNVLKPATGMPVMRPDKDVAWGIYYMTTVLPPVGREKLRTFGSQQEAILAYRLGLIELREKIVCRLTQGTKPVETNVGRIFLNQGLPKEWGFVNDQLTASKLGEIIRGIMEKFGKESAVTTLDKLKEIGFHYITKSGYSWGMADLPRIPEKKALIDEGDHRIEEIEGQFNEGLLTQSERHSQIVKVWTEIKDRVTKLAKEKLPKIGSVASMIDSGARGSWGQLTQIIGMKGPVANPAGDIIELPVKGNFKDGIDVLEYFISTHGARKGLSDTALRTANAGYLTRRLVDVAQDMVIRAEDCGEDQGIVITAKETAEMNEKVANRLLGRYTLQDLKGKDGKIVVKKGELVTEQHARQLMDAPLDEVRVRSVLTCRMAKGGCRKCYGYDLAYNKEVKMGTAVGIMAAQSIGEPGTQLTMRTFHTGGVAGLDITQGLPRVDELFEARPPKRRAFMSDVTGKATVEEIERRMIEGSDGKALLAPYVGHKIVTVAYSEEDGESYKYTANDEVKVKDGKKVSEGDIVVIKADGTEVVAKASGTAKLSNRILKVVRLMDKNEEYIIPPGFVLFVKSGDEVTAGQQLTEGDLDLHQLYRLRGKEAVQKYILKDVQAIYTSQGQKLNDKHVEVIIRQMFSRVLVRDAGDTELLPGEIIEKAQYVEENEATKAKGGREAQVDELFLGITKVALSTQSFLSAASFQETARVLINAAVSGKIDHLEGLKENVIIGRLIPAGTGFDINRH